MLFTKGRWLEGLLYVGLLLAVMALVYFLRSSWRPFPGSFILFITVAGIVVAISDPPLSKPEKLAWLLLTGVLAFLEICAMGRADTDAQKARKDQDNAFALLLSNANDVISNMTGGDSFAYIELEATDRLIVPKLRVEGRYALKQAQLKIIDNDRLDKMLHSGSALSVNEWTTAKYKVIRDFAQISPGSPMILDDSIGIDTNPATDKSDTYEIYAANGMWKEYLRLRKINGQWEHAIRVLQIDEKKPEPAWRERKLDVSQGFPMVDGKPDWGK